MRRLPKTVSLVLGLSVGLATTAWSEEGWYKPNDPEHKAAEKAVLDNEWIENLPYVTDVEASWAVGKNEKNEVTSVEDYIIVMTDTDEHEALLEKQVPGSLEGFPVAVGVDRSKQWEFEAKHMMAKVKPVIDDPANKWILKIPHVIRMEPSTVSGDFGVPKTGAVAIVVDSGKSIREVQSRAPKTIGGFPTTFGHVENWSVGECYTNNGKGCRDEEDDRGSENNDDD
jgi:hypothetical protein